MPLSEFDPQARLLPDGRVLVSGTTGLERDELGNTVPRKVPVHFHFLVVQGGIVPDRAQRGAARSGGDPPAWMARTWAMVSASSGRLSGR